MEQSLQLRLTRQLEALVSFIEISDAYRGDLGFYNREGPANEKPISISIAADIKCTLSHRKADLAQARALIAEAHAHKTGSAKYGFQSGNMTFSYYVGGDVSVYDNEVVVHGPAASFVEVLSMWVKLSVIRGFDPVMFMRAASANFSSAYLPSTFEFETDLFMCKWEKDSSKFIIFGKSRSSPFGGNFRLNWHRLVISLRDFDAFVKDYASRLL